MTISKPILAGIFRRKIRQCCLYSLLCIFPVGIHSLRGADIRPSDPEIRAGDLRFHVQHLSAEDMQGRLTGTKGEKKATEYVARYFQALKLNGAGEKGSFFQTFEFTAGVSLGKKNRFWSQTGKDNGGKDYKLGRDWRPLAFSENGQTAKAGVVFAGYGIIAPATDKQAAYDSFTGLDVKGKWVLVFRYAPENIPEERRQHLAPFSGLGLKAAAARNHGAIGMIVVSGPNAQVKEELVKLQGTDLRAAGSMAALSVTNQVAEEWLQASGKDLKSLQDQLDKGNVSAGFALDRVELVAEIDIRKEKRFGRNVIARLSSGENRSSAGALLIGAHLDHLGRGEGSNSLARPEERGKIHYGADDNASGVAGMLEMAHYLVARKAAGKMTLERDILFCAWSGEELGLLGSAHFARSFPGDQAKDKLSAGISACINMDMIGRLEGDKLILQGIGSSSFWKAEVEKQNTEQKLNLNLALQNDSYLPTDATSFYMNGIPILSAFTGAHTDYHTPRDTVEKLNYSGAERIVRLIQGVADTLISRKEAPDYQEMKKPERMGRSGSRIALGTIPDFSRPDVKGVPLSGAAKGGPADKAGIQKGDVIVGLDGKKIDSIYDYTFVMGTLKVGKPVEIEVMRGQQTLKLTIVPASRD